MISHVLSREGLSLERLNCFRAVADAGSIAKAAEQTSARSAEAQKGRKMRTQGEGQEPDEEDESSDILNSNAKADQYCLVRWDARVVDEHLGENRVNQPAPLIDKMHRLMYLLRQNWASDVQAAYDIWRLAGDPAFPRVLQAVRELALEDHAVEEQRVVESLASQLRMNRRVVENDVVKETSLFDYTIGNREE